MKRPVQSRFTRRVVVARIDRLGQGADGFFRAVFTNVLATVMSDAATLTVVTPNTVAPRRLRRSARAFFKQGVEEAVVVT